MFNLFKWKKKTTETEVEKNEIKDLFEEIEGKLEDEKTTEQKVDELLGKVQEEISEIEEKDLTQSPLDQAEHLMKKLNDEEIHQSSEDSLLNEERYTEENEEKEEDFPEPVVETEEVPQEKTYEIISEEERTFRKIKLHTQDIEIEEENEEPVKNIVGHIVSKATFREVDKSFYVSRNTTHITHNISLQLVEIFKDQDLLLNAETIKNKVKFFNDEIASSIIVPIPQIDIPKYQMLIYQVKKMVKEKIPDNKLYNYTIGRKKSSNELIIKISKKMTSREDK